MTQEQFVAWHGKWQPEGRVLPSEDDWLEFFAADTDGDGVLSHAEFAVFAEERGRGVTAERERFYAEVAKLGQRVRVGEVRAAFVSRVQRSSAPF